MGVVNVTPDSFSDGGEWFEISAAIEHAEAMAAAGADILDIGGESTRPGATRPDLDEELRRVIPVVKALSGHLTVSIDTMRVPVAAAALEAGAHYINDVSGGLADAGMGRFAASAQVPYIAMHWRGHSADMQSRTHYDDVVADVCAELAVRRDALLADGIEPGRLILDPGLGFAKLFEHNWALLAHLSEVMGLGHRVLVGASRKAFLGVVGRPPGAPPRMPQDRDIVTSATSVIAAQAGVWGVRVHDVVSTTDALSVWTATEAAR